MAGPTFSLVANAVTENGIAPSAGTTYSWQINYQGWINDTAYPSGGKVAGPQTSTGTSSCSPLIITATERDQLYAWTTFWSSQFLPPGVFNDVNFATLYIRKNGNLLPSSVVTDIAGTITVQGGGTFPFTAALYGSYLQLLVFWADADNRPVISTTPGATARAEIGSHHSAQLRDKVISLVGGTPVPQAQHFTFGTVYDTGFDFNLDTFERGFEAMAYMGFNCHIVINKPDIGFVNQTTLHRARQLAAGMNDWTAVNLARPPGNGFEWKTTLEGEVPGDPSIAGFDEWAQTLYNRQIAAGYAANELKFVIGYDEPSWFYPFEIILASTGTASVEPPHGSAGYTETGDTALAKLRFQEYLQTMVDGTGAAVTPAYFGWSTWADAAFHGMEHMDGTLHERRRYSATVSFFPYHFARLYGTRAPSALQAAFGVPIRTGMDLNNFVGRSVTYGESPLGGQWSLQHPTDQMALAAPDYLMLGREGASIIASDGWFASYFDWTWSWRASVFRMHAEPSCLLIPMYANREDSMTFQILSLAAHGAKVFQYYQLSPEYVRPSETASERAFISSNGNVTGTARAHRVLAQTEDVAGPGTPLEGRRVAMHWSRRSMAFDNFGGVQIIDSGNGNPYSQTVDWKLNEIGTWIALMHMNVPVDWLDDEDIIAGQLDNYDVLYVSGPNMHGRAQTLVSNWVNSGNVLVSCVGAGTADWDNEPNTTVASLGGIVEGSRTRQAIPNLFTLTLVSGVPQSDRYVDVVDVADSAKRAQILGATTNAADMRATVSGVASGNVVARFANDSAPAIVDVPVGTGRHIRFLYPMGVGYASTGSAPVAEQLPTFSGTYVTSARDFIVTRPLSYTTYKRPVEVSKTMVETGVLETEDGWAIVVLNWHHVSEAMTFRVRPSFTPTSLKKPDGTTIALTSTVDGYTFTDTPPADGTVYRLYGTDTPDITAPVRGTPTANGNVVIIPYNETLDPDAPATTAYTMPGYTVNSVSISASNVVLNVSPALTSADPNPTLTYVIPGANPVQDIAGNDAPAFAGITVTNTTPATGVTADWVTSFTPGAQRTDAIAWVGQRIMTGSSPVTITALARWVIAGNSGTHTVKLVNVITETDVSGGSVSVNTAGATANAWKWVDLATPLTLPANTEYYLVSGESGGDGWLNYTNIMTTTTIASNVGATYNTSAVGGTWTSGAPGMYVGTSFRYSTATPPPPPPPPTSAFIGWGIPI